MEVTELIYVYFSLFLTFTDANPLGSAALLFLLFLLYLFIMEISLQNIKNLSVTVMGLGLNGGGSATADFFARHGARVTVTDLKRAEELAPSIEKLKKFPNIRFILGEHRIDDFKNADVVIKNPGVKLEGNKYLQEAKQIESDISVFLAMSKAPILAVTGSKGKSSTVSALYYGLKKLKFNAFLGGNITVSPLSFLEKTNGATPVVLELSSWQLADLKNANSLKPKIAIITPIMPDHLNWYGTMEKYVADKKLIYKNMNNKDFLICNYDDTWGSSFAAETAAKVFWYGENKLPENLSGVFFDKAGNGVYKSAGNGEDETVRLLSANCKVPGVKLKQNVLNAALALVLYGAEPREVFTVMNEYAGIEHRMEFFYETDGIKFYNDTAATIPEAVTAALNAFTESPVLICGGTNKCLDFTPLAENAHLAKSVFLLQGSGTDLLIPMLEKRGIKYQGAFSSLDELLLAAKSELKSGDTVLFSPGAASFGMFKNEFDRGNCFKEKVKEFF